MKQKIVLRSLLAATLLLLTGGVHAQSFGPAVGRGADVAQRRAAALSPSSLPNGRMRSWSAGAGQAWDWRGHATLAFDAANPGPDVGRLQCAH